MPKVVNLGGQTVLPDRLVLMKQKLVENTEIEKFKCDILGDFQTLWNIATTNFCPLKSNLSGNTV